MKNIVFDHVSKLYGRNVIVNDMNLEIHEGERLVLLGPSGCGKSTTLRMIAGLESISRGDLYMDGERANDVPCGKRNVAMVFQNYAIYPHMTVRENIVYGLRAAKMPQEEINRRLNEVLEMLQLEEYAARKPKDLSGGQRQRVALARAVVKRADYFLLDEPLSNLDAQLRLHARKELVRIHEIYRPTMVYVTHDQIEAMTVGQRIALMHNGDMAMLDTPENVYNYPADVFCAKFIGSPSMNIFSAVYFDGILRAGTGKIALPDEWKKLVEQTPSEEYIVGVRPEHIRLCEEQEGATLRGTVKFTENYGSHMGVYVQPDGLREEIIIICDEMLPNPGDIVHFSFDFKKFHIFDRKTEKSIGHPGRKEK